MGKTKAEKKYWIIMGDAFRHQRIPDINSMPIEDIRENYTDCVVIEVLKKMGMSGIKAARLSYRYKGMACRDRLNIILRMEGLSS